jgi:chemotaxis signal transduction protein
MSINRTQQLCTFRLAGLFFGVPANTVQEMIRTTTRTRVPLVSPVVSGLLNLRGEIVTTIDLRRRLGFPSAEERETATNVVVRVGEMVVSLVVDEVGDVLTIDASQFEDVPATLSGTCRDVVDGVYKLEGQLLLTLDLERLLDVGSVVGSTLVGVS